MRKLLLKRFLFGLVGLGLIVPGRLIYRHYHQVFLARRQGIGAGLSGEEGIRRALETFIGYPARAQVWEGSIFPTRVPDFDIRKLESAAAGSQLFKTTTEGESWTIVSPPLARRCRIRARSCARSSSRSVPGCPVTMPLA